MRGVALHGVDEVGNQIGAALQRGLHVAPRFLNRLVHGIERAVNRNPASNEHDDDQDDNSENCIKRFHNSASRVVAALPVIGSAGLETTASKDRNLERLARKVIREFYPIVA